MPNFKTLNTEERATIEAMRDTLQEQADVLQALLTDGYTDDLRRTLRDCTNMLGEYRPIVDKDLPAILERLKEGRCPECWVWRASATAPMKSPPACSGPRNFRHTKGRAQVTARSYKETPKHDRPDRTRG